MAALLCFCAFYPLLRGRSRSRRRREKKKGRRWIEPEEERKESERENGEEGREGKLKKREREVEGRTRLERVGHSYPVRPEAEGRGGQRSVMSRHPRFIAGTLS